VWNRHKLIIEVLAHPNLDEQVGGDLPIALENMESEVIDALLLHDTVNLLEKIPQIKWIELSKLIELLVRNDDQLGLSLPVEIKSRETPLVIHVSVGCILLLARGAATTLVVVVVTRRMRRGVLWG
tara:strand:+ start:1951 stop:2328 length:378 start_codon:yes stop_codon:yes gene_type:complete